MNYVINLFAGPGAGKSTTAAGLFSLLKLKGIKSELVTEYIKDAVYEGRSMTLDNQFYVTAKQHHKIWRVLQHWNQKNVTNGFIVTDSPILLGLMYLQESPSANKFRKFILEEYNQFNNINIFIERVKEYDPVGRIQTEDEAKELDNKTQKFLDENGINYHKILGDKTAPEMIYQIIKSKI